MSSLRDEQKQMIAVPRHSDFVCFMCTHRHSSTLLYPGEKVFSCCFDEELDLYKATSLTCHSRDKPAVVKQLPPIGPLMPCLLSYTLHLVCETKNVDAWKLSSDLWLWIDVMRFVCVPLARMEDAFYANQAPFRPFGLLADPSADVFHYVKVINIVGAFLLLRSTCKMDPTRFLEFISPPGCKFIMKDATAELRNTLRWCKNSVQVQAPFLVNMRPIRRDGLLAICERLPKEDFEDPSPFLCDLPYFNESTDINSCVLTKVIVLCNFAGPEFGCGFGIEQVKLLKRLHAFILDNFGAAHAAHKFLGFGYCYNKRDVLLTCMAGMDEIIPCVERFFKEHCASNRCLSMYVIDPLAVNDLADTLV
jgi:hypothetical protein